MFVLETDGKVRACFSNKISTVTHKVVMFTLELSEGKFLMVQVYFIEPSIFRKYTKY